MTQTEKNKLKVQEHFASYLKKYHAKFDEFFSVNDFKKLSLNKQRLAAAFTETFLGAIAKEYKFTQDKRLLYDFGVQVTEGLRFDFSISYSDVGIHITGKYQIDDYFFQKNLDIVSKWKQHFKMNTSINEHSYKHNTYVSLNSIAMWQDFNTHANNASFWYLNSFNILEQLAE